VSDSTLQRTDRLVLTKPEALAPPEAAPRLFLNRELSWLAFNERVLDEARDRALPLYERLKFLAIVSSNLDEFFMIRVAGLKQQVLGRVGDATADGMSAAEQLDAISSRVHALVAAQDAVWHDELVPELAQHGVELIAPAQFTDEQREVAHAYFTSHVFPALTPLAVDPGHPFPQLKNKSLNVAVMLARSRKKRGRKETLLAVVQVPMVLGRLVRLPSDGKLTFVLLGELIDAHVGELFPGFQVQKSALFRVTRNSDLLVDEEETEDLLSSIQDELRRRELGDAVRLELEAAAPLDVESLLTRALKLSSTDVYRVGSPLQLGDLLALGAQDPRPELHVEPLAPTVPPPLRDEENIFDAIARRDLILHHPYESYDPLVR
jgi:polyphosphate kinase